MTGFSSRVPDLTPNRFTRVCERVRVEGHDLLDLTLSNPTSAGFDYPTDLLRSLSDPRALAYTPSPFGMTEARRAVAADYQRRGVAVDPDRIALTASTSDAYSLLFKVLCDPGDEILVPRPSYPLFEHLARLDAVVTRPYDLEYHGRWDLDVAGVEQALTARTRAIVLVHPNNPTGSFVSRPEGARIDQVCAGRGVAVIADEVFADYEVTPGSTAQAAAMLDGPEALTFSLGGLSKSIGLPQAKLGWIAIGGPDRPVGEAQSRLELACDTYLSVSTPVQIAAPDLLERGGLIRHQIQTRVVRNHAHLRERISGTSGCRLLWTEGGWSAVLQVPTFESEEDLVVGLLERDHVVVHPGFFFDFPKESFLVVSLLAPAAVFDEGIYRVLRHFDCKAAQR